MYDLTITHRHPPIHPVCPKTPLGQAWRDISSRNWLDVFLVFLGVLTTWILGPFGIEVPLGTAVARHLCSVSEHRGFPSYHWLEYKNGLMTWMICEDPMTSETSIWVVVGLAPNVYSCRGDQPRTPFYAVFVTVDDWSSKLIQPVHQKHICRWFCWNCRFSWG